MKKIDFLKGMKLITSFYNKDFTEEQLNEWYFFFEDVDANDFHKAIKKMAKESKFVPTINDLLNQIKSVANEDYMKIIDLMIKDGYFHEPREIEKTYHFIEEGVIPSWLKADMDKYKPRLELETSQRLAIENKSN